MSTRTDRVPPGVPCRVAQLSPESDEGKQLYA